MPHLLAMKTPTAIKRVIENARVLSDIENLGS
jgi:hypothetical protein